MNTHRLHTAARRLADVQPDGHTDAELLGRFLDARDQVAFAELVARHGPAVLAVCRSVLSDPNDADDAAQATFLVLVRRAAAVRDRAALGGWLCRVAWRTANRLRTDNVRRNGRNAGIDPDSVPSGEPTSTDALALTAVLDEIGKLPEAYRTAVLTCYGTGTSTAEAARQLGWPKGTLLTRLAWARKRLGDRLGRRGVTLAGGFAAVFTGRVTPAAAARLAGRITPAAAALAAGEPVDKGLVSERVLPLTNGVVRAMIGTKLKAAIGLGLLAAVLLGLGLGRSTVGTAEANSGDTKKPVAVEKTDRADRTAPAKADEEAASAAAAGPGKELVVRRPFGSYTREMKPFGHVTLTFTEDRLHVQVDGNSEGNALTVSADADFGVNRESTVYGVITGVDFSMTGPAADKARFELAPISAVATDLPFSFRVRVEDDAVTIKDIKAGPFGTPLFMEALKGKQDGDNELLWITSMVCGKYKSGSHPDRSSPPAPRPKKK